MDLLWQYTDADGKQHCVIVDYKTYPGVTLNEHTTGHYAQLSAYAAALRNADVDVAHALIYYPIHGVIHELILSNKPL
jgi:CRISPR/Cas system-associated exonuclease Cas4 (RecB family)